MSGNPVPIRDLYRKRFGVESSYHQLGLVRPRTSTTDGVVRLRWVAVGLILRNAWVQFGTERGWTLGAAGLVLLVEILGAITGSPSDPTIGKVKTTHARPST